MQAVYGTFVSALPSEYDLEIRELNRKQVFDREEILNLVQAQNELLSKKKKNSPVAHYARCLAPVRIALAPGLSEVDQGMLAFEVWRRVHSFPSGRHVFYWVYGSRVGSDDREKACAVIAPGLMPTTDVDINHYHRTTAHTHNRLLRDTAKQQGVKLKSGIKLLPCVGCSASKGFSKTTDRRSDKNGRVFVDTTGKKNVPSAGGMRYRIIFRCREYCMGTKSDAPEALEKYVQDARDVGLPLIIRSDEAPELQYGRFAEVCRTLGIKREFTSCSAAAKRCSTKVI